MNWIDVLVFAGGIFIGWRAKASAEETKELREHTKKYIMDKIGLGKDI
jgi:hypothetical protein